MLVNKYDTETEPVYETNYPSTILPTARQGSLTGVIGEILGKWGERKGRKGYTHKRVSLLTGSGKPCFGGGRLSGFSLIIIPLKF